MATVSLSGTASSLILYSGTYDIYIQKSHVEFMIVKNTHFLSIGCNGSAIDLQFDSEAQRDAALTTMLTYF